MRSKDKFNFYAYYETQPNRSLRAAIARTLLKGRNSKNFDKMSRSALLTIYNPSKNWTKNLGNERMECLLWFFYEVLGDGTKGYLGQAELTVLKIEIPLYVLYYKSKKSGALWRILRMHLDLEIFYIFLRQWRTLQVHLSLKLSFESSAELISTVKIRSTLTHPLDASWP